MTLPVTITVECWKGAKATSEMTFCITEAFRIRVEQHVALCLSPDQKCEWVHFTDYCTKWGRGGGGFRWCSIDRGLCRDSVLWPAAQNNSTVTLSAATLNRSAHVWSHASQVRPLLKTFLDQGAFFSHDQPCSLPSLLQGSPVRSVPRFSNNSMCLESADRTPHKKYLIPLVAPGFIKYVLKQVISGRFWLIQLSQIKLNLNVIIHTS